MTTEVQPGNITVQHTHQSRQVQAEFLQGSMMDDVQMSMPGFPKGSIDECDGIAYSAWHCLPLSVWQC